MFAGSNWKFDEKKRKKKKYIYIYICYPKVNNDMNVRTKIQQLGDHEDGSTAVLA